MAKTLTATLNLRIDKEYINIPVTDGPEITDDSVFSLVDTLASGTGLDECDLCYHAIRTLTAGANETLDVSGGLADAFGATLVMAKVKLIAIKNKSTETDAILTVGNATNPLLNWVGSGAHTPKVGPNGCLISYNPSAAGFAVTAATADGLKISNASASSVSYEILIMGTSA